MASSGGWRSAWRWLLVACMALGLSWLAGHPQTSYFLSLLITIVQTYIFRRVVNEEKVRAKMAENAKKPRKKSGFMARLEEAQRKQEALMREQARQNAKKRR